jgi:ATP-dependent protease ClpP protease subunit
MEFEIFEPIKAKGDTVWDDYVPIVFKNRVYDVYLHDTIEAPGSYSKLCYILDSAFTDDTIRLHLNTPGGVIDSAFQIRHSLLNTKASTVAVLTGTVASAGTVIALSCQSLLVAPHTQLMIHNYSMGTQGKGHEIMDYVNFNDKTIRDAFNKIYSGFLTDAEMNEIIRGKDMWMSTEEIQLRWNQRNEQDTRH